MIFACQTSRYFRESISKLNSLSFNMKKSSTTQSFAIAAALLCATSTSSAITFTGGNHVDSNWNLSSSWTGNGGVLPTSSDNALLNQNRRAFVDSNVNFGGSLTLANSSKDDHTGVVDVRAGGTFAVSTASVGAAGGSHGRIDVTGGDMTTTGSVINRDTINLSSGTLSLFNTATSGNNRALEVDNNSINNTGGGVLNVTGGALTAGAAMTSGTIQFYSAINISAGSFTTVAQAFFSGTSLTITGDAATIAFTQLNQTVGRAVDFNFNFGSLGVSTIVNSGFMSLAGATINVDGSGYAGGAGEFTLISSTYYIDGVFAAQSVAGFAGLDGVVSASGNNLILTLTDLPYAAELATVAALGTDANMLAAPVMYADDTTMSTITVSAGERKAVYFAGLNYLGNPTRIYAWVGIPAGADTTPVPGMVLVHGGGGTAHQSWVEKWNDRGFAAISIAVEGQTDSTALPVMNTGWHIHDKPGPVRAGIYNDTNVSPITDQWMYHAVADTVLANSLLRSFSEVVDSDVGLSGYSWGGVITSTVIGIDDRFKFAIPTYGCGHLFDARNAYGANLGGDELYEQVWDPMVRIANVTMPVLWFSWPEDKHFPMDSFAYTYHAAAGTRMVSLKPAMGHGSNFNSPETYDFAASIISGGPWCVQQSLNLVGNTATVVFDATKILNSASLVYRTSNQPIISNIATEDPNPWTEIVADSLVESPVGTWTATATLPAGVTGWFVNVKATGSDAALYGYNDANITASSDYQEIIDLSLSPSISLELEHLLADNQSTDTVNVSYSGPANVEIGSITISGESHAGAFSSLTAAPLVLLTPSPDTTPVTIQFDNTVAGLTSGQTATATLTIMWDVLDGSTDQFTLPLSATVRTPQSVVYLTTSDWSSENVDSIDDVTINNGATVTLDQNAPVGSLTVNDATSPTTETLLIDQNFNLTIGGTLTLGGGTGAGIVNQLAGSVIAANLTVNSSGTGDLSQYNLSGGTVSVSNSLTVKANGELNLTGGTFTTALVNTVTTDGTLLVNGGTFSKEISGLSPIFSGNGSIKVQSGSFDLINGAATDLTTIQTTLFEVSGGTVDISGQALLGANAEFRVIGDAATIDLQQFSSGSTGTFNFVFDATGISTINLTNWMHLSNISISVDGSSYTGAEGTFTLFDSSNYLSLFDTNNLTVSGFDVQGQHAYLTQSQANGEDWVQLVVENLLANNVTKEWMRSYGLPETNAATRFDTDGDGTFNWEEFGAGTNPTDADSVFRSTQPAISGDQITIHWNAVSGKTYLLQHKADLTDLSWTTQPTKLLGVEPLSSVTIDMSGTKGFYQIAVE
jgi:dienelactone hydrolase